MCLWLPIVLQEKERREKEEGRLDLYSQRLSLCLSPLFMSLSINLDGGDRHSSPAKEETRRKRRKEREREREREKREKRILYGRTKMSYHQGNTVPLYTQRERRR